MAAAAWSWVEKMLQDDQVTSAPNSKRVSIKQAVWIVMWRHPAIRAPFKGLEGPYFLRKCINPGISFSAKVSSLRPKSAKLMSARITKNSSYCKFSAEFRLIYQKIEIHTDFVSWLAHVDNVSKFGIWTKTKFYALSGCLWVPQMVIPDRLKEEQQFRFSIYTFSETKTLNINTRAPVSDFQEKLDIFRFVSW